MHVLISAWQCFDLEDNCCSSPGNNIWPQYKTIKVKKEFHFWKKEHTKAQKIGDTVWLDTQITKQENSKRINNSELIIASRKLTSQFAEFYCYSQWLNVDAWCPVVHLSLLRVTNIIVWNVLSVFEQQRLWCGHVGAQACPSLCWSHRL